MKAEDLLGTTANADTQGSAPVATWEDIETAPKDETRVLLFNPWEFNAWRIQTGAYYEQLGGWMYDGQTPAYSNAHQPTHWMVLPNPPGQ